MQLSQRLSAGSSPPDSNTADQQESRFPHPRISRKESTELLIDIPPQGSVLAADRPQKSKRSEDQVAWAAAESASYSLPKTTGDEAPTPALYRAGSRAAWIQTCESTDEEERVQVMHPGTDSGGSTQQAGSDGGSRLRGVMRSTLTNSAREIGRGESENVGWLAEHGEIAPGGEAALIDGSVLQQSSGQVVRSERKLKGQQRLAESQRLEEPQQRLRSKRQHLEERMAQGTAVMDVDGRIHVNLTGES